MRCSWAASIALVCWGCNGSSQRTVGAGDHSAEVAPASAASGSASAAGRAALPSAAGRAALPSASATTSSARGDASELSCELHSRAGASGEHALELRVSNRGPSAIELAYYFPVNFALEAEIAGERVEVLMSASGSPVVPRTLLVAAGQTEVLATPITLRFSSDRSATLDPHRWILLHQPAVTSLRALRTFHSHPELPCVGRLTPG